jgi:hypothetical protein
LETDCGGMYLEKRTKQKTINMEAESGASLEFSFPTPEGTSDMLHRNVVFLIYGVIT